MQINVIPLFLLKKEINPNKKDDILNKATV